MGELLKGFTKLTAMTLKGPGGTSAPWPRGECSIDFLNVQAGSKLTATLRRAAWG
jgi:hypothetical protein